MAQSETQISRQIQDAVARLGVTLARTQSGKVRVNGGWMQLAPEGWPDLTGYLPNGRFLGIEVKRPGQKPSAAQFLFGRKAAAAGAVYLLASSVQEAVKAVQSAMKEK